MPKAVLFLRYPVRPNNCLASYESSKNERDARSKVMFSLSIRRYSKLPIRRLNCGFVQNVDMIFYHVVQLIRFLLC